MRPTATRTISTRFGGSSFIGALRFRASHSSCKSVWCRQYLQAVHDSLIWRADGRKWNLITDRRLRDLCERLIAVSSAHDNVNIQDSSPLKQRAFAIFTVDRNTPTRSLNQQVQLWDDESEESHRKSHATALFGKAIPTKTNTTSL
jgi:hypothetical protein